MGIKSNAGSDEFSSPFYIENEKFCNEFERYITSKEGFVKGSYNAFSYLAIGKIPHKNDWIINCRKATYSNGNLFLSSKYQNLLVALTIHGKNFDDNSQFKIRKKKTLDILSASWKPMENYSAYSMNTNDQQSDLFKILMEILGVMFHQGEIFEIEFSNKELKIELRTESLHKDMIDNLISLSD